jgi:hypothetical protein
MPMPVNDPTPPPSAAPRNFNLGFLFLPTPHLVNLKTLTNENPIDSCQCNWRRIAVCSDSRGRPLQSGRARYRWRSPRRGHRGCDRCHRRRRAWCCCWCRGRRRCRGCRRGRYHTPAPTPAVSPPSYASLLLSLKASGGRSRQPAFFASGTNVTLATAAIQPDVS